MAARAASAFPAGLGPAGKALWTRLTAPAGTRRLEFSRAELVTLELAAHQADDVAQLEKLLAEQGAVTAGSKGQPKLSGVPAELRQQRFALARLVSALALPSIGEEQGVTPAQRKAQKAAEARWARAQRLREARRGAVGE